MRIHLIAIGIRMPKWVQLGYDEYARRMPRECELVLKEIVPGKRSKNSDVRRIIRDEGRRMLAVIPPSSHAVALDLAGRNWNTAQVAEALSRWRSSGKDLSLLIGGPDGLSEECKTRTVETWSLSSLTFPHPLVRIIVAEQLYRAWTILRNHPYHRCA